MIQFTCSNEWNTYWWPSNLNFYWKKLIFQAIDINFFLGGGYGCPKNKLCLDENINYVTCNFHPRPIDFLSIKIR